MLGWWICVQRVSGDDEQQPGQSSDMNLASWTTGPRGVDWIDGLVKEKKLEVRHHSVDGMLCVGKAESVLPFLRGGLPRHEGKTIIGEDYILPGGWPRDAKVNRDAIHACPGEALVEIEYWDLS